MSVATLIFSNWSWLWFAATVTAIALATLLWSYLGAQRSSISGFCLGLKLLGFTALALCLLEPLWSGQRARPGANLFAIVADNSQGLQIKDRDQSQTRGEALRGLLGPQHARWQDLLAQNFDLRKYFFDSRLQTTKDFSELNFEGAGSAIMSSLGMLAERYRGRPLAGILLMTDGNTTDLHGEPNLAGLPPIYPVVIGDQQTIQDIAIQE